MYTFIVIIDGLRVIADRTISHTLVLVVVLIPACTVSHAKRVRSAILELPVIHSGG